MNCRRMINIVSLIIFFVLYLKFVTADEYHSFPFSGWTRNRGRSTESFLCFSQNCLCTTVESSVVIADCSLASDDAHHTENISTEIVQANLLYGKEIRLLIMGSELEYLNETLFHGTKFQNMHIKYNHGLKEISSDILDNSKSILNILDLRNNNLSSLPFTDLISFTNLEFLSLDDNLIEKIGDELSNSDKIIHIGLANNRIKSLDEGSLTNLYRLKFLDLHGNNLRTLTHSFIGLESLISLILYDNPLLTINPGESKRKFISRG